MKVLAKNKRARYDYTIEDTMIAGIVLSGQEVKSVRSGNVSLKGSYVTIKDNEAWLVNTHIGKYEFSDIEDYEPTQSRKLLLKKSEIKRILAAKQNGRTSMPLAIGLRGRYIKLEIGIGPGKKNHDKRHSIKQREEKISIQKSIKNNTY